MPQLDQRRDDPGLLVQVLEVRVPGERHEHVGQRQQHDSPHERIHCSSRQVDRCRRAGALAPLQPQHEVESVDLGAQLEIALRRPVARRVEELLRAGRATQALARTSVDLRRLASEALLQQLRAQSRLRRSARGLRAPCAPASRLRGSRDWM